MLKGRGWDWAGDRPLENQIDTASAALTTGGDCHVPTAQEGESPEHPLLGNALLSRGQLAYPIGESLVVRHHAIVVRRSL